MNRSDTGHLERIARRALRSGGKGGRLSRAIQALARRGRDGAIPRSETSLLRAIVSHLNARVGELESAKRCMSTLA